MKFDLFLWGFLTLAVPAALFAEPPTYGKSSVLKNAVILVIRHAEKPASGLGLAAEGEIRAQAYVSYFKNFAIDGQALKLECLFAAADSKGSHRSRLTLEPTGKALGLAIDTRFKDNDFQELVDEIQSKPHGTGILIAWHHGQIPALLRALGADPGTVIPNAKWPDEVFGWVIQLRYDTAGRLIDVKRINEHLLPDDSDPHAQQ